MVTGWGHPATGSGQTRARQGRYHRAKGSNNLSNGSAF